MRICFKMLILDKGYLEIRNKYIHPLSQYYIQYRQLKNYNIKNILLNNIQNVQKNPANEYIIDIDEEKLFKALLGDIFLFYIKSIVQKNDFEIIRDNVEISPNWNIVTSYYKSFYNASLLLRICFRGNIFLDKDYKKRLSYIVSTHIGEVIELDSNMFYFVEKTNNGGYCLRLTKSQNNTHETVWYEINHLLEEIMLLSNKKSEEKAVLISCLDINRKLSATFPSKLRNKVNYQPIYGMEAIDKRLLSITNGDNWVKEIIGFDIKEIDGNDNRLVNIYTAYTTYIEKIAYRLIQDYFEMVGREDHILAQINRLRENKIVIEKIPFVY